MPLAHSVLAAKYSSGGGTRPTSITSMPAPPSHGGLPLGAGCRAKGPAQAESNFFVERGRHNAADIVGFENGGCGPHARAFRGGRWAAFGSSLHRSPARPR